MSRPLPSHPVTFQRARRLGLDPRNQPHRWHRVGHDLYLSRHVELTHGQRILAWRLRLPPGTVLFGPSAAWALGARLATARDPVEVTTTPRPRSRPGLVVHGTAVPPGEVSPTKLGPATSPLRTIFDLTARAGPRDLGRAVAWADAVLRCTATARDELLAYVDTRPGARGVRRARRAAELADPGAESPRESMLRVALVLAGLPAPTPQVDVFDDGGHFVARLDLAWPDLKLAVEYDGAHHRERDQHSRDLRRHNRLRALGWQVIQVDADQFWHIDELVALIRATLARRV